LFSASPQPICDWAFATDPLVRAKAVAPWKSALRVTAARAEPSPSGDACIVQAGERSDMAGEKQGAIGMALSSKRHTHWARIVPSRVRWELAQQGPTPLLYLCSIEITVLAGGAARLA